MDQHEIYTTPILPLGMINTYVVKGPSGAVLVDTGMPGTENKITATLVRAGLRESDIKLIVITHGHIDHAGCALQMRERTGAPILLHEGEQAYCAGETAMPFHPTGPFGRLFKKTGVVQQDYPRFTPDIRLSGEQPFDLAAHGVSGAVLHTPGHTPGSVSVCLEDGRVLAGDLAASGILLGGIMLKGWPKRPPFEEDPAAVAASLEKLLARGMTKFYLGHGGPLPATAIRRHIAMLRQLS